MTTQEIANRLSELLKENKWTQIQEELFSENAKSIEPAHSQGMQSVEGLENIKKKGEAFDEMVEEMHGGWASEPIVGGNFIAVSMGMDVTFKGMERTKMEEIALYEVKDGKIVREEFFY
ncbi:MAG: nuclear transport factor 2 family protein [Chitinophagaceae bacterium]|nr:nuclear transport factor 2 family protein [Chitinophagaceae bacterium]